MSDAAHARHRDHRVSGLDRVPFATCIVTTASADGAFGQTAVGLSEYPAESPSLMACVFDDALTALVRRSGSFRINVSSFEHDEIADAFGETNRIDAAVEPIWEADAPAGPLLCHCVVSFSCRLAEIRTAGGLTALIGEVTDTTWHDGAEPLLRVEGKSRRVEELPVPMFPGIALARRERKSNAL